ncbi:MAG: 50S ribosomal protein L9 [Verrucomicrobia bacterium]|nr:50S ribosomal protein L9 [Verrucomicrobiota bacterium]
MRNQLLLLEDVEDLGRSGDVVSVKPGYSRNFLVPQKKAVVADKFTLRMQAKLKEERAKRAELDRAEAEALSKKIDGMILSIEVKVDPDGHMYGSVAAADIVRLFEGEGIVIERRNVALVHPIKALGAHSIQLKLKEGVPAQITLHVVSEGYVPPPVEAQEELPPQE